jgi:NADPH:quinone reductase-like Zn-dependent oxidoreductase
MTKALRLRKPGGLENLYVDTAETGAPGPGQIAVRLHANALNYHDYLVAKGLIPTQDGIIPMSDGAGVVTAVGPGVTEYAVGDHVVSTFFPDWHSGTPEVAKLAAVPGDRCDGYARESVVASALAFTKAPKGYTHAEAATLTCAGLTAWRALAVEGQMTVGQSVLVQGTGGVSVFALQFAKAAGCTVIATSSSDAKLQRLKAMGADHVINYKTNENWGDEALRLTGGRGVDHVVEVGGAGTLNQSFRAVRNGGHVSLIGVLSGFQGDVATGFMMMKQVRLIGITVGSREHQLDMIRAIEANGIKPVIDKTFPLDGLADAYRHQESGAHFGKICLAF